MKSYLIFVLFTLSIFYLGVSLSTEVFSFLEVIKDFLTDLDLWIKVGIPIVCVLLLVAIGIGYANKNHPSLFSKKDK